MLRTLCLAAALCAQARGGNKKKKSTRREHGRDRKFLVQRSRFLAALNKIHPSLKTRLGLVLAKAAAMRVRIHATGCPAPVSARPVPVITRMVSTVAPPRVDTSLCVCLRL